MNRGKNISRKAAQPQKNSRKKEKGSEARIVYYKILIGLFA
jgi:hypothetical protein